MKKILILVLMATMMFLLSITVLAAPKDKITADNTFMSIFDPGNAVTLDYEPGQKAAVAIPSNAHYADYASEGFWFIWGGDKDLGALVSAKQKDTGFVVLADYFFEKYESLTITVKSSNEYRNVTFTEQGTYFIDQFLLKNEKKGPEGGYHNINWIGVSMVEKPEEPPVPYGTVSIEKWVDGRNIMEWAVDGFDGDLEELIAGMTFKLYPVSGPDGIIDYEGIFYPGELDTNFDIITFPSNVPVGWYAIVEELNGLAAKIFEVADPLYIEVFQGENNYVGAPAVIASGGREGLGVAVKHDGSGMAYVLPDVWDALYNTDTAEYYRAMKNLGAQWVWDTEDTFVYGLFGSTLKIEFTANVESNTNVPFYFACDNAAVVYVNGQLAGKTEVALANKTWIPKSVTPDMTSDDFFRDLTTGGFDGRWEEGWTHAYMIGIDLEAGENVITIFAANSVSTGTYEDGVFVRGNTGTPNDDYSLTNNPCGLIFAMEIPGTVFENKTQEIIVPYTTVYFDKLVDSSAGSRPAEEGEFGFQLYIYDEENEEYVLYDADPEDDEETIYYPADDLFAPGRVTIEKLYEGKYFIRELAKDGYDTVEDMYFEVVVEGSDAMVVWADGSKDIPVFVNTLQEYSFFAHIDMMSGGETIMGSSGVDYPLNGHQWKVFTVFNNLSVENPAAFNLIQNKNNRGYGELKVVNGKLVIKFTLTDGSVLDVSNSEIFKFGISTDPDVVNQPHGQMPYKYCRDGEIIRDGNTYTIYTDIDLAAFRDAVLEQPVLLDSTTIDFDLSLFSESEDEVDEIPEEVIEPVKEPEIEESAVE